MLRTRALVMLCASLIGYARVFAQNPDDINARIRKEENDNSQIMRTMHFLTDVYGPRLTGSPNLKAAGEWALKQMTSWGFENGHLEPWDFGHPGWTNERFSGFIISPVKDTLTCVVLAWTPGTNGPVGADLSDEPSGEADAGRVQRVPRNAEGQGQRKDRACGQEPGGCRKHYAAAATPGRQAGKGALRSEQSERRPVSRRASRRRRTSGPNQTDVTPNR